MAENYQNHHNPRRTHGTDAADVAMKIINAAETLVERGNGEGRIRIIQTLAAHDHLGPLPNFSDSDEFELSRNEICVSDEEEE